MKGASAAGFVLLLWATLAAGDTPVSGYASLGPEMQAMQDDEFENPGMVAVERGAALFGELREDEPRACDSCTG